jgi:hypothetical protein
LLDTLKDKHIKDLWVSCLEARLRTKYLELFPDEKQDLLNKDPSTMTKMKRCTDKQSRHLGTCLVSSMPLILLRAKIETLEAPTREDRYEDR